MLEEVVLDQLAVRSVEASMAQARIVLVHLDRLRRSERDSIVLGARATLRRRTSHVRQVQHTSRLRRTAINLLRPYLLYHHLISTSIINSSSRSSCSTRITSIPVRHRPILPDHLLLLDSWLPFRLLRPLRISPHRTHRQLDHSLNRESRLELVQAPAITMSLWLMLRLYVHLLRNTLRNRIIMTMKAVMARGTDTLQTAAPLMVSTVILISEQTT